MAIITTECGAFRVEGTVKEVRADMADRYDLDPHDDEALDELLEDPLLGITIQEDAEDITLDELLNLYGM